tara:strand:- start:52627 stop:53481 length:855 start_codon:yes stop_codon:yes gene_type:complete
MKAAREDRLESHDKGSGFPTKQLLLVVAIVVVAYVLWQSSQQQPVEMQPEPVAVDEIEVVEPGLPPAEDIPPPAAVAELPAELPAPAPPALPPLAESDAMVQEQLAAAGAGPELQKLQQQQNLIQQGTALIEGFSRGLVLRKLLPLDPPKGAFPVEAQGEQMFMSPAGYARYDNYADAIATLDSAALVNNFHTMRPLFEQAYSQLGLPAEDFDNAVIRVLDRILATPEIEDPIALTRKSVMYQYADPQLEQLTPLQKQLLRMGPDNIRRVKEQAAALRAGFLSQ